MEALNTEGGVAPSSQDLQTSGCTEVRWRRSARPTPSTFSTGTAQTLGERKERPVPGSHHKARLSQHESATPTAPLLSPRSQPTSSSGATPNPAGEGGGGTAATRPFHPTQTAAASSARFPNTGGSRCVVQLRPERAEGARRHHCSRRPPAGAKPDGRRSQCVRGITGPPALPPRPRLNSHKAHRDEAAGTGLGRGGRGEQGTATAAARRFPSGTAIGAAPPAALPPATTARPALRHRPPPGHTPPARARTDTPPAGHRDTHI